MYYRHDSPDEYPDQTLVHNPSAVDVWFCNNHQTFCVKAGETLRME